MNLLKRCDLQCWLCLFMFGPIAVKPVQTVNSPDYNRYVKLSRESRGSALATEVWHVPGSSPSSGKDFYV